MPLVTASTSTSLFSRLKLADDPPHAPSITPIAARARLTDAALLERARKGEIAKRRSCARMSNVVQTQSSVWRPW
eukprot:4884561-Pleurochrysis_carterae.AAC.1